jgi:hypothetical protein
MRNGRGFRKRNWLGRTTAKGYECLPSGADFDMMQFLIWMVSQLRGKA